MLTPPRFPRHCRGLALVIVLWVLTLLTVIAGSFAYSARTNTWLTANQVAAGRARAFADAGVYRGLYELLRPASADDRWSANGWPRDLDMDGVQVRVTLVPETARIDLNTASDDLLKGALVQAGADEDEAQQLLEAILDWRDGDDLPRLNGAERDQYLAAGSSQVPTNAPFQSVEELGLVLRMRPEVLQRVLPVLTVYSGQSGLDSTTASAQALLALPGADAEMVQAYVAQRSQWQEQGIEVQPLPAASAYPAAGGTKVYTIRSSASLPDGTRFDREAVAMLTTDPRQPFMFIDWKDGKAPSLSNE